MIAIALVVREPERGESDNGAGAREPTSVLKDLKYLARNWSWIWITLASTCVAFCTGSISVWVPSLLDYADYSQGRVPSKATNSILFGVMAMVGGIVGTFSGSFLAQWWRRKAGHYRPDAWVCGISVMVGCPVAYTALSMIQVNKPVAWALVCLAIICFSMNWPVVADILMYTTVSSRRSTAIAVQTLVLHLLGDAAAPTLIGLFSDFLRGSNSTDARHYTDLKYAMILPVIALILAGVFFLLASFTVDRDRQIALKGASTTAVYATPASADTHKATPQL
jgi:hypothetical protein